MIGECPGTGLALHQILTDDEMKPYHDAMKANRITPPVECPKCGRTIHTVRDDCGLWVGSHT